MYRVVHCCFKLQEIYLSLSRSKRRTNFSILRKISFVKINNDHLLQLFSYFCGINDFIIFLLVFTIMCYTQPTISVIRDLYIVDYGKRLTLDTRLAIKVKSFTVKYITYIRFIQNTENYG